MFQYSIHNHLVFKIATVILLFGFLFESLTPAFAYAEEVVEENTEEAVSEETISEDTSEAPSEEVPTETEENNNESRKVDEVEDDEQGGSTDTEVTTGDATSQAESESIINTNSTDTRTDSNQEASDEDSTEDDLEESTESDTTASTTDETTSQDENASSTDSTNASVDSVDNGTSTPSYPSSDHSSTTVENTNTATSTTNASTTAETGDNNAIGTNATIDTGDAVAYIDVLNVVNTNITNSDGLIDFVNDTLGYQNFDLRNDFEITYTDNSTAQSTPPCSLSACGDTDVNYTVSNSNDAVISNNISVVASTGGNSATGTDATIDTGDAYASANVINVANTNITDSNYLLLVFNNFDDYAGDIVLPNSDFFDDLFAASPAANGASVTNENTADVTNNVDVAADTGGNTATGNDSSISTGDASAQGDITNLLNSNITGSNSFSMLIRVHGSWSGDIFGLPEGMSWTETPEGIRIFSTPTSGAGSLSAGTVNNTNNATINNNVSVYALTGDNEALGTRSSITTGNAHAEASILNIANTNVVGSNWANLIFNIYGNWSGNLAFGQPDLWVGVQAKSPDNPIMPGSPVTYTYTIFNHGDTRATDVRLDNFFEPGTLAFNDTDTVVLDDTAHTRWNIGTIEAGETKEVSYTARTSSALDKYTVSAIPLTARVFAHENDPHMDDNEDTVTIYTGVSGLVRDNKSEKRTFLSRHTIEKTASRDIANPGDVVDYAVKLFNRGGILFDAVLVDVLRNESGEIIQEQAWSLGDIKNGETVVVDYSVAFDSAIPAGVYTNAAQLIGFHGSRKKKHRRPYESGIATHQLTIGDAVEGEVLGANTDGLSCPQYLTTYMRYGQHNDVNEVTKLQQFLNIHTGSNLAVTGFFNLATEQAVRSFQHTHAADILTPWGINHTSGYVYYTTQKKINEIHCDNQMSFELTPAQLHEISVFKDSHTSQSTVFGLLDTTEETYAEDTSQNQNPVVVVPSKLPEVATQSSTLPRREFVRSIDVLESEPEDPLVDRVVNKVFAWIRGIMHPKLTLR